MTKRKVQASLIWAENVGLKLTVEVLLGEIILKDILTPMTNQFVGLKAIFRTFMLTRSNNPD